MSGFEDPKPGENASWQEVFEYSLPGLRAFLRHRLRQPSDIDDCLQAVSVKMMEKGENVAPAARRAWLFRVAANEAARVWRSRATTDRILQKVAHDDVDEQLPEQNLTRSETTDRVANAIESLPEDWRQVVFLRIHEDLTFQQIADRLNIPLGTALTRMRRALERLKQRLDSEDS